MNTYTKTTTRIKLILIILICIAFGYFVFSAIILTHKILTNLPTKDFLIYYVIWPGVAYISSAIILTTAWISLTLHKDKHKNINA